MVKTKLAMMTVCLLAFLSGLTAQDGFRTDLVQVSKKAPAKVSVGEEYTVTIAVTAVQPLGAIVIKEQLPANATLVKTTPAGDVQGKQVTWMLDGLKQGQTTEVALLVKATAEGEIILCGTVTATPLACVTTIVGKPELQIAKSGPAEALLGSDVQYTIVVENPGSATATNVVVTDTVPDGLEAASGQKTLTFNVGDLAPKARKEIPVVLKAVKRGRFCNQAVAASGNAGTVNAEACTVVKQRLLEIAKSGIPMQFVNKQAKYEIVVSNPGDVALTNVVVTDRAPAGTTISDAPGASVSGNTATWQIASLAPGAKETKTIVLTGVQAGNLCNEATVATAEGLSANSQACTEWKGHPALLIEVIDTVDPLIIGEETEYVITITNQGTSADKNLAITVQFPAETDPIAASGATATKIAGKLVTVTPVPVLNAKEVVVWRVKAKAVSKGDSRLTVKMTSEMLQTPVTEEESTQVY